MLVLAALLAGTACSDATAPEDFTWSWWRTSRTTTPTPTQPTVARITVSPGAASVDIGATRQYTATTYDASGNVLSGRAVTWSSSNTARATVNASGVVTGVSAGSATLTATSEGQTGQASVSVTTAPPSTAAVASVAVSPATLSIAPGASQQLTATLRDANGNVLTGRAVSWSSSNTGRATVSTSGVVTGVSAGTVTVTATSEGRSGQSSITVSTGTTSGQPWFSWDWTRFNSLSEMRSAAHFCCNGTVSLESGALPDGSSGKFMRAHLRGNGTEDVTDYDIRLPSGAREIWMEFWLRFDPRWRIRSDDKTLFLFSDANGGRRWELHYGAWGTRTYAAIGHGAKEFIVSDSEPGQWPVVSIWDGQWHRHRIYARMASSSTATDGALYWWVGNNVLLSNTKAASVAGGTGNGIRTGNQPSDFFHSIRLGANADPTGSGVRDWGPIRVWTTNPGW